MNIKAAAAAGLAAVAVGVVGWAATTGPPLSARPLELPRDMELPGAPTAAPSGADPPIEFPEAVERGESCRSSQLAIILILIGMVVLAVVLLTARSTGCGCG